MAQPSKSESVPFESEKEKVKTVDGMKPNRGQVEDERFFRIFNNNLEARGLPCGCIDLKLAIAGATGLR